MSILIQPGSIIVTDTFGDTFTKYKGNAGSVVTFKCTIEESIDVQSSDLQPIYLNKADKRLTFQSYGLMNGFIAGQNVDITLYKSGGGSVTRSVTIVSIDYNTNSIVLSNIFVAAADNKPIYDGSNRFVMIATDPREDLYLNLNYTFEALSPKYDFNASAIMPGDYINKTTAFRESVIDRNFTRYFANTSGLAVGDTVTLVQQGMKSGHYFASIDVKRIADVRSYVRAFEVTILSFNVSAFLKDPTNLNFYFDLEWYSDAGAATEPTVTQWNFKPCESGWYNLGYRTESPIATLGTGIVDPVYYDTETEHTVTIDSTSSNLSFGATYCPSDPFYFQNKFVTQSQLSMVISLNIALSVGTYQSGINPDGAQWEIEIVSLDYTSNVHTIVFKIRPVSSAFGTFIESRTTSDRVFNIWFQSGNTNVLVWQGIMEKSPLPVHELTTYKSDDPVPDEKGWATHFIDKLDAPMWYSATSEPLGADNQGHLWASVQDNILSRFYVSFEKGLRFSKVTLQIVCAEVADPDNYFVLEEKILPLDQQVFIPSGADEGITQFNISQLKQDGLPANSGMNHIRITRFNSAPDTETTFGATIYYPFVVDWKYWIAQANAFIELYPNQNRNYYNLHTDDYKLCLRMFIETDQYNIQHLSPFFRILDIGEQFVDHPVHGWGGANTGFTKIQLFDLDDVEKPNLIKGTIMKAVITVEAGEYINPLIVWGQVAIEPFEGSPLYRLSSNYAHDNSPANPLFPIDGEDRIVINPAVGGDDIFGSFTFMIDCSKLVQSNQTIYLKYWNIGTSEGGKIEEVRLKFDLNLLNEPTLQFIVEQAAGECCEIMDVFASQDDTTGYKNNVTSAWHLLQGGGDEIEFKLYKDCALAEFQPTKKTFVNEPNGRYVQFNWRDVLLSGDGEGVYELRLIYTLPISGAEAEYVWGKYRLQQWSRQNVSGLVSIVAVLNRHQSIEGMNFTGTKILDTLNVPGVFGSLNPKTEIKNNILSTRQVVSVVNENVNEYFFEANSVTKWFSRRMFKLFFLSATDLYFTDYNWKQHESYIYFPAVVNSVDEPVGYNRASRNITIRAKFGDQFVNERAYI